MERCPPEILHHIFDFACNDGGHTARSLSLVSRTIYHKSRYSQFHSISCNGPAQLLSFARILDSTPAEHRVVRHLCLTVSYRVSEDDDVPLPSSKRASFLRLLSRVRLGSRDDSNKKPKPKLKNIVDGDGDDEFEDAQKSSSDHLERLLHGAILHILTTLNQTLYTLSLYLDCSSWIFFPFPSTFPLLTELSIKHPFTKGIFRSDALIALKSCPRLRKLVLTGYTQMVDPVGVIERIGMFGERVTHLCVPFNAQGMFWMLKGLKERMSAGDGGGGCGLHALAGRVCPPSCPTAPTFPHSLERLFLHSLEASISNRMRRVSPIFPEGTRRYVAVERVWDQRGREKEAHLMWERMWIDGIGGGGDESGGDGYWRYPDGYFEERPISNRRL